MFCASVPGHGHSWIRSLQPQSICSVAMHLSTVSAALLSLATIVHGHGNTMDPVAVWTKGYSMMGFSSEVNNLLWGPMDDTTDGYGPEGTVQYLTALFPKSKYKTLNE